MSEWNNYSEFLLDTNIVTYLSSDTNWRKLYLPVLTGKRLFIGFMTLAELWESACHREFGERKLNRMKEQLARDFVLIPFCDEICEHFGRIRSARRNRPISVPDALIAATALAYNLTLVTHNAEDFKDIPGLNIKTLYQPKK